MQCSTFYVTDIPSPKPKCPSSYNSRVQTHLDHCCHQKSSLPFQLTSLIYSNNDWENLKPSPSMELAKEKVGGWWETKWELDVIKGVMSGRRSRGDEAFLVLRDVVKYEAQKAKWQRKMSVSLLTFSSLITMNQPHVVKNSCWCMPHLVNTAKEAWQADRGKVKTKWLLLASNV